MTEPRLIRCPQNHLIRWHAVPIDPWTMRSDPHERTVDVTEEGVVGGLEPELWAMQIGLLFERVARSRVGRVLVEGIRMETTVYHGTANQSYPDTLRRGAPEGAYQRARSTGAPAMVYIDLRRGLRLSGTGLPRNHEISLVHELAHAAHITWGLFDGASYSPGEVARFDSNSPEETDAWIVENMFRLERRVPARRTYLSDQPMPPGELPTDQTTGIPLRTAERDCVARLTRKAPLLVSRLAAIPTRECPYNPFR
ncbi:MAG: hypothetical protein AB8I08_11415 [Sandaracinaceae bacterium]